MAARAGTRRKAPATPPNQPPKAEGQEPAPPNHNGPSEDEMLAYIARLDQAQEAITKAAAALKAANKARTNLRQVIKGRGVKLKNLDAALEKRDLHRDEQRADIQEQSRYDALLGNVTWEDADLFAKQPEDTARDAADWEGVGYTHGLRLTKMDTALLKDLGVPPVFHQDFMRGHDRGMERMMHAVKTGQVGANPPAGQADGKLTSQLPKDEPPADPAEAEEAEEAERAEAAAVHDDGGEPANEFEGA